MCVSSSLTKHRRTIRASAPPWSQSHSTKCPEGDVTEINLEQYLREQTLFSGPSIQWDG